MSELFTYICTRSTAHPYIPPFEPDIRRLSRDVSDAFVAIIGGHLDVGELKFFPVQRSVPNFLLCDGREVPKISFPELFSYLGTTQGTAVDPDSFVLPNYIGAAAFEPAAAADTETVTGGTTNTPPPTANPDTPNWEWYDDNYGDTNSGGKPYGIGSGSGI